MSDPVDAGAAADAVEKAKSEAAKSNKDEKKSEGKKSSAKSKTSSQKTSVQSEEVTPVKTHCCCCVCVCSNNKSYGTSCCGCLPVKCGVTTIGIFTLVLVIFLAVSNFFLLLNEYIHWWHPTILLVLLVPAILATCFFVVFFTKDKTKTRSKLPYGCILIIISFSLAAIWTIVYYLAFYKHPVVYVGMNGEYTESPKKPYVFFKLLQYVVLIAAYTYFLCVCQDYKSCMKTEAPKDDAKSEKSKKSNKSKKSEKKEEDKKDDAGEGAAEE